MKTLKPRALRKGDLIGLATPASPLDDISRLDRGIRYLETLGYRVLPAGDVRPARGYLAGTDDQRAAELNALFEHKEVKAIFCVRGGYGTPRLLSLLRYASIARNPKIFVGYSDITAIQLALWRKCRLPTFHGMMLGTDFGGDIDPFAEEWFWRILTSRHAVGNLPIDPDAVATLRSGPGRGILLGGNFCLLVSLLGTRYAPGFSGSILFLEDTDEECYRIDRMFVHLRHASVLKNVSAILLGQFTKSEPSDPTRPTLTLREVFDDVSTWTDVPIMANLPFGHIPHKLTLPIGIMARVNTGSKTLELVEGAVR